MAIENWSGFPEVLLALEEISKLESQFKEIDNGVILNNPEETIDILIEGLKSSLQHLENVDQYELAHWDISDEDFNEMLDDEDIEDEEYE